MKKNLLFIGASGRLGSYWIKNISKKFNIFIFQNKNLIKTKHRKIKFNLLNKRKLQLFCQKNTIGIIINCSGITNLNLCEKMKKKAYKINVQIPLILSEVSKKNNIKYVHISTDHLFDGNKKKYSERSRPKPLNYYAKTKMLAEKNIQKTIKNFIIIRTNFFLNSNKKDTFLEKSLKLLRNGKKLKVWDNVNFSPLHVDILIKVANILIKKDFKGIINVSSNQVLSKYELISMVAKHLKFDTKNVKKDTLINKNSKLKRPLNMALSNYKLKKMIKNNSMLNIKNQIKKFKYV